MLRDYYKKNMVPFALPFLYDLFKISVISCTKLNESKILIIKNSYVNFNFMILKYSYIIIIIIAEFVMCICFILTYNNIKNNNYNTRTIIFQYIIYGVC